MNDLVSNAIQEAENRIPVWMKIALAALSLLTAGFASHDFVEGQLNLGPRMEAVEEHVESSEPLLKYLACTELAENTTACVFILRDSKYFDEFRDLGILPTN